MKLHLGRGACPTDAGENNLCRELSPASVGRAEKFVFVSEREIFMKTDNKRYIRLLAVLCMIVYFVSYLTRINYSAVLVEIVNSRGISKTEASLAVTASALSYGIGQLVSGYFGDRIKPHRIVFAGLLCTAAMNFILPLFASTAATVAIWTINGFAQAMMWPPIVKILTAKTEGADYQKATVMVSSWGSSGATIFVYLVSPLIIHSMGWKAVFFFASTAALLMSAAWMILFPRVNGKLEDISVLRGCGDRKYEKMTWRTAVLIALVMIAIVIHGSLRDGITTWMPTYVSETFNLKSEISFDEPLNTDWDGNELLLSDILGTDGQEIIRPLEDDADREMLRAAISLLGERERQIILMRFGFVDGTEYTQKEVADMMGISQSYISRLEKRIIARLHREMLRQMQV